MKRIVFVVVAVALSLPAAARAQKATGKVSEAERQGYVFDCMSLVHKTPEQLFLCNCLFESIKEQLSQSDFEAGFKRRQKSALTKLQAVVRQAREMCLPR